ncbi:phenylacetaldoxime dehydratase family protein [Janthinobacterium sp. PC23-8]|uniref:phenylacetaldoxime dehydratase family protein n=1 Tax=Janthinobacterium sp. PC23-8 TaxID=2012679 RepID=UPI000B96D7D0|nr:phenylacetaldoxime dehydratase family protein [Janthinobacterium sp. PC23-8]OYO30841.1 phenylacetaldoxime dehydratase [Janthinobacterium sp. PC23-8]
MESAIAPHLQCPRTLARRAGDEYQPNYPCWSARAGGAVTQVVMAHFGVQSLGRELHGAACRALALITASFTLADGPGHHDLSHYVDAESYDNMIAIAYWDSPQAYLRWSAGVAAWWDHPARLQEGIGYFREIHMPHVAQFETMFNTPDHPQGVGVVMGSLSGEIREHGYWGAMRDRLPLAQTDALAPDGALAQAARPESPGRLRVAGHDNLAIIRSGQDWGATDGQERALYLEQMAPVLVAGMNFLRDEGRAIGCYSNRYMTHIDAAGRPLEKTFGVSHWRSLDALEQWAEFHPTHVEIFGTFLRMVQALAFQLKLSVFHEVAVLKPHEQDYEYINCHPRTGLLGA